VLFHKCRRTMHTGLEHTPRKPKIGYKPVPGLITLFSRTCTCRRNPNPQQLPTSPPNLTLLDHWSYAEVVREGMEGNRKFGHGSGPHGIDSVDFCGQPQGSPMLGRGISGHTSSLVMLDFKAIGEVEGTMISAAGSLEATSYKQSSGLPRATSACRMRRQETWR
jgi:hypothetical protein